MGASPQPRRLGSVSLMVSNSPVHHVRLTGEGCGPSPAPGPRPRGAGSDVSGAMAPEAPEGTKGVWQSRGRAPTCPPTAPGQLPEHRRVTLLNPPSPYPGPRQPHPACRGPRPTRPPHPRSEDRALPQKRTLLGENLPPPCGGGTVPSHLHQHHQEPRVGPDVGASSGGGSQHSSPSSTACQGHVPKPTKT